MKLRPEVLPVRPPSAPLCRCRRHVTRPATFANLVPAGLERDHSANKLGPQHFRRVAAGCGKVDMQIVDIQTSWPTRTSNRAFESFVEIESGGSHSIQCLPAVSGPRPNRNAIEEWTKGRFSDYVAQDAQRHARLWTSLYRVANTMSRVLHSFGDSRDGWFRLNSSVQATHRRAGLAGEVSVPTAGRFSRHEARSSRSIPGTCAGVWRLFSASRAWNGFAYRPSDCRRRCNCKFHCVAYQSSDGKGCGSSDLGRRRTRAVRADSSMVALHAQSKPSQTTHRWPCSVDDAGCVSAAASVQGNLRSATPRPIDRAGSPAWRAGLRKAIWRLSFRPCRSRRRASIRRVPAATATTEHCLARGRQSGRNADIAAGTLD